MIITIRNVKGCYEGKEIQSQNHRIVEMIGELWRSPDPSPCNEYNQQKQVAQGHVLLDFEYLKGWRHHNLSGKPMPVFNLP